MTETVRGGRWAAIKARLEGVSGSVTNRLGRRPTETVNNLALGELDIPGAFT